MSSDFNPHNVDLRMSLMEKTLQVLADTTNSIKDELKGQREDFKSQMSELKEEVRGDLKQMSSRIELSVLDSTMKTSDVKARVDVLEAELAYMKKEAEKAHAKFQTLSASAMAILAALLGVLATLWTSG